MLWVLEGREYRVNISQGFSILFFRDILLSLLMPRSRRTLMMTNTVVWERV